METTGKEKFLQFKNEFQELAKKYNYKGHAIMIEPIEDPQDASSEDMPFFHWSAVLCSTYETDPTPTECLGLMKARDTWKQWPGQKMKKIIVKLMASMMLKENATDETRIKRIAQSVVDGFDKTLEKNTGEWSNPFEILASLFRNR